MDLDKEGLKELIEISLYLEYLGIHEEESKYTENGLVYFFSVPEKSTIEPENEKDKDKFQTSDGLIKFAKDVLTGLFLKFIFREFDEEDQFDKKFMEELEEDPSKVMKFYAKVRKGEAWTEEMGRDATNKITEKLSYKEV